MTIDIAAPTPGRTTEDKLRWEKVCHLRWRAIAMSWEDSYRKARNEIAFLRKANYDLIQENTLLKGGQIQIRKTDSGIILP
jgi:hypothetical protein